MDELSLTQDNSGLATGLNMWIGHGKEIRKLMFRALAFRRSESIQLSLRRRANARNISFRISLRLPIHIITPVDKT